MTPAAAGAGLTLPLTGRAGNELSAGRSRIRHTIYDYNLSEFWPEQAAAARPIDEVEGE